MSTDLHAEHIRIKVQLKKMTDQLSIDFLTLEALQNAHRSFRTTVTILLDDLDRLNKLIKDHGGWTSP